VRPAITSQQLGLFSASQARGGKKREPLALTLLLEEQLRGLNRREAQSNNKR
jgi:hypothetical protein